MASFIRKNNLSFREIWLIIVLILVIGLFSFLKLQGSERAFLGLFGNKGRSVSLIAPTSLQARASSSSQIVLTWFDNNTKESGFAVERSFNAGTGFIQIATTAQNLTTYSDLGLQASTTYYYRVRAFGRNDLYSSYSNIASATTYSISVVSSCPNQNTGLVLKGIWVWNDIVATDILKRNEFFNFAESHGVVNIYLESEGLINNNQTALANFIDEAAKYCMNVELLYGNAGWALTANHEQAIALAQKSVTFSAGLSGHKPTSVHFDIEPYLLTAWTIDQNGTANQYIDLLEKLITITRGTGLSLVVDNPFWFDGITISRNGQAIVLSNKVIGIVDKDVLMDYRDTANLIIDFASNELNYAKTVDKAVIIGVETQCGLSPTYLTFCEEGATQMESILTNVKNAFSNNTAFKNFAVHYYDSYKILKP